MQVLEGEIKRETRSSADFLPLGQCPCYSDILWRDIECYMCLFLFISMFTWSYSWNWIEINLQTIQISTCTNNHYTEIFWFCSPAEELRFVTDEDGKNAHDVISLKNTLPYPIAYKVNMFNKFWIHMDAIFSLNRTKFVFVLLFKCIYHTFLFLGKDNITREIQSSTKFWHCETRVYRESLCLSLSRYSVKVLSWIVSLCM